MSLAIEFLDTVVTTVHHINIPFIIHSNTVIDLNPGKVGQREVFELPIT